MAHTQEPFQLSNRLSSDRRSFLKGTAALGAAAMTTASLSRVAHASTPKSGGTLRQALRGGATSDSLDGTTLQAAHPISVFFFFFFFFF